MKYCMHCGQSLTDDAHFCDFCGAAVPNEAIVPVQAEPAADEYREENECLSSLRKMLRGEHLAWKISTWVLFGITLFYTLIMIFCVVIFQVADVSGDEVFFFSTFFSVFIVYFLILITPVIVVGFVMSAKTKRYMEHIHDHPEEAIERCGHPGTIVLAALFNEIALIFVIINFVRCKTNRKVFDRIVSKRRG